MFLTQEVMLGNLLKENGLSLAVAESCTGGLVGHLITNVPGSSAYFSGGVIAYANEVKIEVLGVSPATLESFGAVSKETVLEMAKGIRALLEADIGLSVSGIAGPEGGTKEKPVGTVWIGLSSSRLESAKLFKFSGDRQNVKEQAAQSALEVAIRYLSEEN
jgi:PncC family amidohydrolase